MKRYFIKTLLLICIVVILPALSAAEGSRRDGNWWSQKSELIRLGYIAGFVDGMDLGRNFTYWDFIADKDYVGKVLKSYDNYSSKYFNNLTVGQLAEGLDSFYADFRNLNIPIADAVWVVVNGIAGTPQAKLDTMIENFRRNAR